MQSDNIEALPDDTNFYASFYAINKNTIKDVFIKNGWLCRKASWIDYELINDWSELILEGEENKPLLHGPVVLSQTNIQLLDKAFQSLSGGYVYEFYDDNKNLLLEKKNNS
jgi:hypothetical protein